MATEASSPWRGRSVVRRTLACIVTTTDGILSSNEWWDSRHSRAVSSFSRAFVISRQYFWMFPVWNLKCPQRVKGESGNIKISTNIAVDLPLRTKLVSLVGTSGRVTLTPGYFVQDAQLLQCFRAVCGVYSGQVLFLFVECRPRVRRNAFHQTTTSRNCKKEKQFAWTDALQNTWKFTTKLAKNWLLRPCKTKKLWKGCSNS